MRRLDGIWIRHDWKPVSKEWDRGAAYYWRSRCTRCSRLETHSEAALTRAWRKVNERRFEQLANHNIFWNGEPLISGKTITFIRHK